MKIKYPISCCAAVLLGGTGMFATAEESGRDIAVKFETEKAEALDAYLKANAEAEDRDEALAYAIQARTFLQQSKELLPLLKERYDSLDKGEDADLNVLVGAVIQPLFRAYRQTGDKEAAAAFVDQARKDLESHPAAPQLAQFFGSLVAQLSQPGVGETMEIAFTDLNGQEVNLSEMKDKVVLVDFWATWCGPCIAELPKVISAYEKYKDKGFEVIGISLDQDRAAWETFIKARGMDWPQTLDGESGIAKKYGISTIPATFLIGKDGKIVASDLRGSQLEDKLAELFD